MMLSYDTEAIVTEVYFNTEQNLYFSKYISIIISSLTVNPFQPSENPTENSPELFLRQFLEDFILTRLIPRQLKVMSGAICLQCVHLDNQLRMTANEVKNKVNTNKELEAKINSTENKLILKVKNFAVIFGIQDILSVYM